MSSIVAGMDFSMMVTKLMGNPVRVAEMAVTDLIVSPCVMRFLARKMARKQSASMIALDRWTIPGFLSFFEQTSWAGWTLQTEMG